MLAEAAETVFYLEQAVSRYNVKQVAEMLGKAPKTITRWRTGQTPPPPYLAPALQKFSTSAALHPVGTISPLLTCSLASAVSGLDFSLMVGAVYSRLNGIHGHKNLCRELRRRT